MTTTPTLNTYQVQDYSDGAEPCTIEAATTEEAASEYVRICDYPEQPKTHWVELRIAYANGDSEMVCHGRADKASTRSNTGPLKTTTRPLPQATWSDIMQTNDLYDLITYLDGVYSRHEDSWWLHCKGFKAILKDGYVEISQAIGVAEDTARKADVHVHATCTTEDEFFKAMQQLKFNEGGEYAQARARRVFDELVDYLDTTYGSGLGVWRLPNDMLVSQDGLEVQILSDDGRHSNVLAICTTKAGFIRALAAAQVPKPGRGGYRPGSGRPELPTAERRTLTVRIPVNASERAELLERADGRPLATWLRGLGLSA